MSSLPIRMALARISHNPHDTPVLWGLLLPVPGQLAGLRGPAQVNRAALDAGAIVICHQGSTTMPAGIAWIPHPVGSAMQWTVVRAAAPLPPPTPADTAPLLRSAISATAAQLTDLSIVAGNRPDVVTPHLTGHRPADQRLLDSAWTVMMACDAGQEPTTITAYATPLPKLLPQPPRGRWSKRIRPQSSPCRHRRGSSRRWWLGTSRTRERQFPWPLAWCPWCPSQAEHALPTDH